MKVEQVGDVTVAHLDADYSGLEEELLEATQQKLLDLLDSSPEPKLVLNFRQTQFFSSTFIEVLFRLWNRVNRKSGRFALAELQPFCFDILRTAKLHTLWKVCPTVDEAIAYVRNPDG